MRNHPRILRQLAALLILCQLAPEAPLWLMQMAAWSKMLVTYSREAGLQEGVSRTFDGQHPCAMCKRIDAARAAQSSPADSLQPTSVLRMDGLRTETAVRVDAPASSDMDWPACLLTASHDRDPPPAPPPRLPV